MTRDSSSIRYLGLLAAGVTLVLLPVGFGGQGVPPGQTDVPQSTVEQIAEDFASIPCANDDRLEAVKGLWIKHGAAESDLAVARYPGVDNLVLVNRGRGEESIIVGAHYDKSEQGCGAIDNWSGLVVLAHLYRGIKANRLDKTVTFVAFGQEEKGRLGSKAMASALRRRDRARQCAMINLDSLGKGTPQVMLNTSSERLATLALDLAAEMDIPSAAAEYASYTADSASFLDHNIPAITLHGLGGDWTQIIHTPADTADAVRPESVHLVYRLAMAMILRVDAAPCDRFRTY